MPEDHTASKQEIDARGDVTGVEVEAEEATPTDGGALKEFIVEPFNPEDIDVVTRSMTVDLILSRIGSGMIDLQPDFQRRWGIWDSKRKSRLIESLLLRIPLPVFYAAEDEDEKWEIVDGIQRLSTITQFIEPATIDRKAFKLSELEYLKEYNGKNFADLSGRFP